MELRDYLRIIRRRWLLIVACLLVGLAGGAALTVAKTPQYSSTARLFVSTPASDQTNSAYQGGLFSQQRVASYANLIQGTTIAQAVIDKLHLDETAVALTKQISATAVTNTVVLDVTVTDPSPARAQRLAQTTAEVFSAYVPDLEGADSKTSSPIKATIVDAATLPSAPVSPRPTLNLGLGGLLGLLVGFGLAFLRETLDNSIKDPITLHEVTGASALGAVHYDPLGQKKPLITQLDVNARRIESFRVLRTNLQFLDVDKPSKVFAITSPLPSEGKTCSAINLAITLAQAGQRTLLLETDLRRPRIPTYLNLEKAVGLTTVLIGRARLDDVIQPWGENGLDVVTSGATPPNPSELLQSQAMAAVLAEVRSRYDIVIIDAAPLLPVTDAALVASAADGAIMVVRYGKTTKEQAAQSAERLEAVDAKLLGTVLNFAPAKGGAGYGYGYYEYYDYSPKPEKKSRKERRAAESSSRPTAPAADQEWRAATQPDTSASPAPEPSAPSVADPVPPPSLRHAAEQPEPHRRPTSTVWRHAVPHGEPGREAE